MKKAVFCLLIILTALLMPVYGFCANDIIRTRLNYNGAMHDYEAEAVYISINGESLNSYTIIPLVMNDSVLVCARDVFEYLDCSISWDNDSREVTVKNSETVIVIPVGSKTIYKNGSPLTVNAASMIVNGYTMIPVRAVAEGLGANVGFDNSTRTVSIVYQTSKNGSDTVKEAVAETTTEKKAPVFSTPKKTKGLKILWDTISSYESNDSDSKRIPVDGLDVICPTWFEITDGSGTVKSIAKKSYADWAHSEGYEVWGLVTNSFDPNITTAFLNNEAAVNKIITDLLGYCVDMGIDGINVDFETIYSDDGEAYVEFMKKLADAFHDMNLTVSVDTFVPAAYNEKYHMADMGEICDYVIMMAYDEHYSTDTTAGSVSSLPWAESWLEEAVEIMDSDKLIFGCPFYTRAWHVTSAGYIAANNAYGMDSAQKLLADNGAEVVYDEETGQNYGEYPYGGNTVKIWLEDETSLRARLELSQKYGCGGVSFWRRGFENSEAWDIINQYYN
ncbi:MAG: glycosyl hydrolase family 18 protein [Clostridiales bacterium]|nr:glycosyl hydrolase family 18 protein [Clostridiales bacterium]